MGEWQSTEAVMAPEEKQTHENLRLWMQDYAKRKGVAQIDEAADDDAVDDDEAEIMKMLDGVEGEGEEEDEVEAPEAAPAASASAPSNKEKDKEESKVEKDKN